MEESKKISFDNLKKSYIRGEGVSCTVVLKDFQPSEDDSICLHSEECSTLSNTIAFRLVKDTIIENLEDAEGKTIKIIFKDEILNSDLSNKYRCRYVSKDSEVLAESSTFEIEDGTISSESFLTIQSADSFDDTLVLVNKTSTGKVSRMEEDFKKLCEQLIEAKKKIDEQDEYCEILQKDVKKKDAECEEERDQRDNAEKAVEELGRKAANQMQLIEEQGQRLENLERKLSREAMLNTVLKEDMEAQRTVFEENSADYENLKMKAISFKTEYKHAKQILEDERELFEEASLRYDDEILQLKRKLQQLSTESNLNNQQAKIEIQELENSFETEKQRCLTLQSSLKKISAEYDEYLATNETEIQIAKEKITDMEYALKNEEEKSLKDRKDHDSTVDELEKKLLSEKTKAECFACKYEEMKKRATAAEENLIAFQLKLEEADRKMLEMQELVKGSKSELEMLKNAVSVEEICIHKSTQSDSQIGTKSDRQCSIERRSEMLLQERSLETSSSKYNKKNKAISSKSFTKSREETKSKGARSGNEWSWEKAKEHTIHREVFNNNNESKRYNPRFYERKRQQGDAWYLENQRGKDNNGLFARPERQAGQLRQHRNSLLRENSNLRYSMSMLSHDCAILNYTLQQVVLEAEQKLEALYSMYLNKESQCAAYESQMQGGLYIPDNTYSNACQYSDSTCQYSGNVVSQYDQYGMQHAEYVDGYQSGTTYLQNGAMYPVGYTYCDGGYYEVYPQQDGVIGQPVTMDQMQYVQPVYVS